MAKMTIEGYTRALDRSIELIAHVRRMAELDGLDMDEFDKALNDLCREKYEKFAKMDKIAIGIYGMKIVIEAGKGRELFEKIMEGDE